MSFFVFLLDPVAPGQPVRQQVNQSASMLHQQNEDRDDGESQYVIDVHLASFSLFRRSRW